MVYITVEENNIVGSVHRYPFDPVDGMGKTEEELLKTGKLVEDVPEFTYVKGKSPYHKYDPDTNSVYVAYVDAPAHALTIEEEISLLKQQNAQMLMALVMGGLI